MGDWRVPAVGISSAGDGVVVLVKAGSGIVGAGACGFPAFDNKRASDKINAGFAGVISGHGND